MNQSPAGLLQAMNRAWTGGKVDAIGPFLANEVVFVTPDFSQRLRGREACVDSFRQFVRAAQVHDFREEDWQVDEYADTAVVSYRFTVDYSMQGKRHVDTGRDLYVLKRMVGRWRVIWRGMVEG